MIKKVKQADKIVWLTYNYYDGEKIVELGEILRGLNG